MARGRVRAFDAARWADPGRGYRAAFDLWRGPFLADVVAEGWLADEASRFDELRCRTAEGWIGAELRLGRQDEVIPVDDRVIPEAHDHVIPWASKGSRLAGRPR
ncbi:hypothetical protein KGQ19_08675 [Catenulispora sp. NL8]|uniref:Bacterial transcriptional activator domain-containing protein n=1 Tax=Catenulispora pinistramenti TaxID=2705254 RepID=A0ABS5KLM3_9ACTN|nr:MULTISPECIES: BTAD domain-containing putative transcriptional regulator [Catenulispora]MBS2546943.1 hypothetical protein [Catenulispora pinistramenti]